MTTSRALPASMPFKVRCSSKTDKKAPTDSGKRTARGGAGQPCRAMPNRQATAASSSTIIHGDSVGQCGNVAPRTMAAVQDRRFVSSESSVRGNVSVIAAPRPLFPALLYLGHPCPRRQLLPALLYLGHPCPRRQLLRALLYLGHPCPRRRAPRLLDTTRDASARDRAAPRSPAAEAQGSARRHPRRGTSARVARAVARSRAREACSNRAGTARRRRSRTP